MAVSKGSLSHPIGFVNRVLTFIWRPTCTKIADPVRAKKNPRTESHSFQGFPDLSPDIQQGQFKSAKLFPQQGSGRSSDFPDQSCAAPSQPFGQWHLAAFVPGYSGGPVHDSNVVPYCAPYGAPERERSILEQMKMSRGKKEELFTCLLVPASAFFA